MGAQTRKFNFVPLEVSPTISEPGTRTGTGRTCDREKEGILLNENVKKILLHISTGMCRFCRVGKAEMGMWPPATHLIITDDASLLVGENQQTVGHLSSRSIGSNMPSFASSILVMNFCGWLVVSRLMGCPSAGPQATLVCSYCRCCQKLYVVATWNKLHFKTPYFKDLCQALS